MYALPFHAKSLHLYLVSDEPIKCHFGLFETIKKAIDGGVTIVQYRSEEADAELVLQEARALKQLLHEKGIPLIINNNIELAIAIDADGLHIGQGDITVLEARQRLGKDKILGLSVSNEKQVLAADIELLDYLGMGPIFPTISKMNAPPVLGIEEFARLSALTSLPVVAIGGIDATRALALRATGMAAGIAVVSAICSSENPRTAAKELC